MPSRSRNMWSYKTHRRVQEERHVFHGTSWSARLDNRWRKVQASFWFIPSLMSMFSWGLAVLLLYLDRNVVDQYPLLETIAYNGGADGANDVLTLVASSMIGIAGVTFSITIVALTLASGHFGPRLLRNFMKDLGNQIVLGTYIASFVYCLWVVQAVRMDEAELFVPGLSVSGALVLALAGLVVLIFFFHHVSTAIQAGHVIADAYGDLIQGLERQLFPVEDKQDQGEEEQDDRLLYEDELLVIKDRCQGIKIAAAKSGYVQAIDYAYLLSVTKRLDGVVELHIRAGDFLFPHGPILTFYSSQDPDEDLAKMANAALFVGSQKTAEQDIEYSLDQLVEIAVRALSPGVNDPGTAITCVDYLAAAAAQAAQRQFPSGLYRDDEGQPRVFARRFTFTGLFHAAFHQIRQNSGASVALYARMLEVFGQLAPNLRTDEQKRVLAFHAQMVYRSSQQMIVEEEDLKALETRYGRIQTALLDWNRYASEVD